MNVRFKTGSSEQPSWAQTTTTTKEAGKTEVTTEQITGEVVLVDNNILLARMQPSGQYRMFNIQPSQLFMIDGKSKRLIDLTLQTTHFW